MTLFQRYENDISLFQRYVNDIIFKYGYVVLNNFILPHMFKGNIEYVKNTVHNGQFFNEISSLDNREQRKLF